MAMTEKTRGRLASRFHFLTRFLGLTGLLVGAVGLVLRSLGVEDWGLYLSAGGGAAAALALLYEFARTATYVAGRRSAVGTNVAAQLVLACVLLVGVNAFSFYH